MPEPPKLYTVFVDDNYHYMDESERSKHGVYETVEEALSECREIVDECLTSAYEPGMTSGKLMAQYVQFGEDPWISPPPDGGFSARDYARGRCKELCRAEDAKAETTKGRRIDALPPELTALKPVIAALLTRPGLTAEHRQLLELMRSQLDAIPLSFPDRSFYFIVKPTLRHADGFFANVFNAELKPAAYRLYWGTWEGKGPSQVLTRLAELQNSFFGAGEGDKRVGNPQAMLEPMARAAADETFMLIAYSDNSD